MFSFYTWLARTHVLWGSILFKKKLKLEPCSSVSGRPGRRKPEKKKQKALGINLSVPVRHAVRNTHTSTAVHKPYDADANAAQAAGCRSTPESLTRQMKRFQSTYYHHATRPCNSSGRARRCCRPGNIALWAGLARLLVLGRTARGGFDERNPNPVAQ
jgi:hypothetical protein